MDIIVDVVEILEHEPGVVAERGVHGSSERLCA